MPCANCETVKFVLGLNILLKRSADTLHRRPDFKIIFANSYSTEMENIKEKTDGWHQTQAHFMVAVPWFSGAILKGNWVPGLANPTPVCQIGVRRVFLLYKCLISSVYISTIGVNRFGGTR